MYQCRTSTRQRISQGLPATLRAVAHSVITACVAFASLTMRIAPGECGFGAEDIGHVCCEQAGCGLAASGQQRSPRCAFDLAGAVCAGSLAALEAARQAWKVLNGGWTAVCSWRGSCWPWWASGEDLSLLHATGPKCGCRFACSDVCTVCLGVVTQSANAENDVHSCKNGQPILTASASHSQEKKTAEGTDNTPPKVDITSSVQQPDFRPQPLPPPRLEGEGSASDGCKRRTQALKPNRAHRRVVQRRRQQYARRAASLSARRKVPVGAARGALVERLVALPPLARRRRVAMWRRRWRRDRRRRRDGPGACGVEGGVVQPTAREQTRPKTFWDKAWAVIVVLLLLLLLTFYVWAVPIRVWNALMRAYYGNKLPATSKETAVISTLNVAGRMRLRGVGDDKEEWGTGDVLAARATEDWNKVERWMEGRALVVLTDLCVSGRQLKAMCARLRTGTWQCYGTPGHFNRVTGERTAGVLVVWDERCYVSEGQACVHSGRVVAVRLQDCRAMQAFTVFGAYMPVRGRPEREVRPVWEALGDAVADAGLGRIILGDLNAELPDALQREGRQPKLADELLQALCEEEDLITAGPDQPTYTRKGREGHCDSSQIDHILCDAHVAPTLGDSEVLPGLSENDHWMLQTGLLRQVDAHTGPQRHGKLPLWELNSEEWNEYAGEAEEVVRAALESVPDDEHARRLRAIEEALMDLARRLLNRQQEQRGAQRGRQVPGSGHRSAEERLRSDVGRWEQLCRVVTERDHTHGCFLPTRVHGGSRRAFARVKELASIMRDSGLSSAQRRHGLLQVCKRELAKARAGLAKIQTREGDGLVEAFEEAINEGGEGGVCVRLFEILKAATGKGRKIKWRGQKQEGKTRYKGPRKPPVKLSSLYKGGNKANGIVTGAKEVLAEVRAQAAATNGLKQTFPDVARELMKIIRPFPEQEPAKPDWADDVCTWERFESAVGRVGADVGGGFGWLLRLPNAQGSDACAPPILRCPTQSADIA